tara:strand:+ start:943 stop:2037 length:1095 start_codon:yes stop_codon:yes gene_type:complete
MGEQPARGRMTYGNYLRLDDMLSLQEGPEGYLPGPCNDELHFIIVHQAFELWFKLVVSELKEVHQIMNNEHIEEGDMPKIVHHLKRVTSVFNLMSQQWKVMETLTPQDFLSFRDRLGTSSGFESWQLRQIETILGLEEQQRDAGMDPLQHMQRLADEGKISSRVFADFESIINSPSLKKLLDQWLERTPINGSLPSDESDEKVVQSYLEGHLSAMENHSESVIEHFKSIGHGNEDSIRNRMEMSIAGARDFLLPEGVINRSRAGLLFIESYRELPLLSWPRILIDSFVELEEALLLFRNNHARMVERMIGRRMGTGGSSGVDYLDATLKYRIFVDLWTIRTILVKRDLIPNVENPKYYGFTSQD